MREQIICGNCGVLTFNRGLGLCPKCYGRYHYIRFKDKIDAQRRKWWPSYYQKNKARMIQYALAYHKRNYVKEKKAEYDRRHRDLKRFNGQRELVMRRADYSCELCHSKENLHVHHKDGRSYYNGKPNNDPSNLMVLCRDCHYNKVHRIRGPLPISARRLIAKKKKERDAVRQEIKKVNFMPEGETRTCELCGVMSKHNSVIDAIALNDDLILLPEYRQPYKLTPEEKGKLGPGIHFICRSLIRCRLMKTKNVVTDQGQRHVDLF